MPLVEFEPTNAADERSQTKALDRAATGTDHDKLYVKCKLPDALLGNLKESSYIARKYSH